MVLESCLSIALLHGFVIALFFWSEVVTPRSTLNLEDERLHFVWPLHFDLSGVGLLGVYAPGSIDLRVIGARKPLHGKALVL
jgi:hypothetical protein